MLQYIMNCCYDTIQYEKKKKKKQAAIEYTYFNLRSFLNMYEFYVKFKKEFC